MTALRDDYSGPFEPGVTLASFSRQALSDLTREYLMNGHMQDRVGLPLVAKRFGGDAYLDFSIEEWMGASPIYTLRMQRALDFVGNDVGTVFRNLQFEIGAPQQFMDFHFRLDSPDYGEFWLPHCGALMDLEPYGEERVKLMCHDIEDPTFDATAAAANPRMKMRPIHRPPREPAARYPHCRWAVFIDGESKPYEQHENLEIVGRSKVATVPIVEPKSNAEPGGWDDYAGEFDPHAQPEDFSHSALLKILQEAAVQSHLLARAFMLSASQREGDDAGTELGEQQWTGIAALTADRIQEPLGIKGDDIEAIAKVFQLHPCFHPRTYVDLRVQITGDDTARIAIGDCPALDEGDPYSWFAGLGLAPHRALDAIAGSVNRQARCEPAEPQGDEGLAWHVIINRKAEPQDVPQELKLAQISKGAAFRFERRRGLRA